jgi:DNA-binding ferritin-like protein
MGQAKQIRVIKGGRAARETQAVQEVVSVKSAAAAVREVKEVVSDWVRDHRQRSDEFRRNYSTLLGEMGFKTPSYGGRTA